MEIIKNSNLKENIDNIKIGNNTLSTELGNRSIICIGSQILYDNITGTGPVSKTGLIGAYDYTLIDGLFAGIIVPDGWHKEFRLTFQAYTSGNGLCYVYINNIKSSGIQTWSANAFRTLSGTNLFTKSDIILEPTLGYSRDGVNLYYEVETEATGVNWGFWNITIQGYLAKD